MVELLDAAAQVLCPTPDSFNACQQFINELASEGPVQQMLFFLFFPTIFIILFIYILTTRFPLISENKGIRFLMAIAIFALTIVQGWYPAALAISRFWFIAVIILGGLWFFVGGHFRGRQEGGTGRLYGITGGKAGRSLLKEMLLGKKLINPMEIAANNRLIEDEKKILEARIKTLQDELKKYVGAGHEREREHIVASIKNLKAQIAELDKIKKEHYEYIPSRKEAA